MNRQAKDILTILRVSGYYDSELTANLLSVVDEKASAKYLKDIDKSFTNVRKHEGIDHELRVGLPTINVNEITLGDSLELCERIPAKTVDLILEDMPYH